MKTREISNSDDVIDSRDVIARIDELESEIIEARTIDCEACTGTGNGSGVPGADDETECSMCEGQGTILDALDEDSDEWQELKALKEFAEDAEWYCADWKHGETFIHDSYFEQYARETADDLGLINRDESWPYTCIDWGKAADELKQDYRPADWGGETYWFRS